MVPREDERFGRFHLGQVLGRGAFATVWRAYDPRELREVALKVFHPGVLDGGQNSRREHEAFGRLSHPNVVRLHEVVRLRDQSALAMELAPGSTLARRIARGTLDVELAVSLVMGAARGLAHIHDNDLVHRDVKPSNLLLTSSMKLKVADLGLARFLARPGRNPEVPDSGVWGTLPYMSPEQVRALPADRRSDVFSLGAVLFECLSGQRAFRGETDYAVATAVLHGEPDWLALGVRKIMPMLRPVIARALEKDPARRYPDMRAFAQDLEFALAGNRPALHLNALSVVGRRGEIDLIARALEDVTTPGRPGRSLLVTGEAGIGKSHLLEAIAGALDDHRMIRVSRATFRPGSNGLRVLLGALDALAAAKAGEATDTSAPGSSAPSASERDLPLRLEEALRRIPRSPFLLVLENLQDAGTDALPSLRLLLATLPSLVGLLLCSYRTESSTEGSRHCQELLLWAAAERLAVEIPLGRFELGTTMELAEGLLGKRLDDERAARLQRESAGNPLFLVETLRFELELEHGDGRPRDASSSATLGDILAQRLRVLAPGLRTLLEVASIEGDTFGPDTVAAILGEPRTRVLVQIESLVVEHRLVVPDGDRYRLTHGAFRDLLESSLPPERRRALHRELALWLRASRPDAVQEIARHYAAGEEYEDALPWLERAVDLAARQGAPDAERTLTTLRIQALEQTGRSGSRAHLEALESLGRLEQDRGHRTRAEELLTLVARAGRTHALLAAKALHHLGWSNLGAGAVSTARRRFERARTMFLAEHDPIWAAACLDAVGVALRRSGDLQGALKAAQQALRERQEQRFAWGVALSRSNLGVIRTSLGQHVEGHREFELCYRYLHGRQPTTEVRRKLATAASNLANACNALGQLDRAIEAHAEALALHKEVGNRLGQAITLCNLADVHQNIGRHEVALEEYERAILVAEGLGPRSPAYALAGQSRAYAALGAFEKARDAGRQSLPLAREAGDLEFECTALLELARIDIATGEVERGRASHLAAQALVRKHRLASYLAELAHVEGLLEEAAGRPEAATRAYDRALAELKARPSSELLWRVLRDNAAVLAEAPKTRDRARKMFARARSALRALVAQIGDPALRQLYRADPERQALLSPMAPRLFGPDNRDPPLPEAPTASVASLGSSFSLSSAETRTNPGPVPPGWPDAPATRPSKAADRREKAADRRRIARAATPERKGRARLPARGGPPSPEASRRAEPRRRPR